jgi:hypothetical protein
MLERGLFLDTFYLSLIHMIVNIYSSFDYIGQLIRSVISSDLILHMILKASVEDVY